MRGWRPVLSPLIERARLVPRSFTSNDIGDAASSRSAHQPRELVPEHVSRLV
jgi:hypothetical protein